MDEQIVLCRICDKTFSKTSNLRKHAKKFHAESLHEVAPYLRKRNGLKNIKCKECGKSFVKELYLNAHVKKFHADKFNELCPPKLYNFKCDHCGNQFTHKFHYKSHLKLHNSLSVRLADPKINCPLCQYKDSNKEKLISHYQTDHSISFEIQKFEFNTAEELSEWKSETEKEEKSFFVSYSHSRNKSYEQKKYICHRSGVYSSRGNNVRHLKTQGSNKINGYCPANICVTIKDNKFEVLFQKRHVGHDKDLGHLHMTNAERELIASKIAAKIPLQTILDDVRDSLTNGNLERIHLLTKKDLYNIEQSYNLNGVKHKNDVISVESWIKDMEEEILYYKPQAVLQDDFREEDFILCIMTNGQKEVFKKYCGDCICVDGTHGLNAYGFQLHTLLVLNNLREGFPCAFLITNRSDEEVLTKFFSCIRERVGIQVEPKVFMSDMAQEYYNAWLRVMWPAESQLYCTWHVDRAWRKNLSKIDSKEKQAHVYKNLRMLLQETDVAAFSMLLEEFLNLLSQDQATIEFFKYFCDYYVSKKECWAYCYRINTGLNTNMHIERLHKTIKYLYLNGKHVKRLDIAINSIMKFVRDKLFETLIIDYKGKLCTKIKNLRNRHEKSTFLNEELVIETPDGWQVPSSSCQEIYLVERREITCDGCQLICNECKACLHKYTCTCLDACIKWNMCKHIHLVCRTQQKIAGNNPSEINVNVVDSGNLEIHSRKDEILNLGIVEILSRTRTKEDLYTKKEKLKASVCEIINSIDSHEQFEAIEKIFAPAKPTLMAMKNNKTGEEKKCVKVPHNKNIKHQRYFVTTKKKRSGKKAKIIEKPSQSDINATALNLLFSKKD